MGNIDFWYSIGSTYSYLTVMRLPRLAQEYGVNIRWRPFNVRDVMVEQNNVPFSNKPIKSAYMWRDIERQAQKYGIPVPMVPAAYPLKEFDRANLVGVIVNREGRYLEYFNTTYKYWFLEGLEAGSRANLEKTLVDMGLNVSSTLRAFDSCPLPPSITRRSGASQPSSPARARLKRRPRTSAMAP